MSLNDYDSTVLILELQNQFYQAGKFEDIEYMNNQDQLYINKYIEYKGTKYSN